MQFVHKRKFLLERMIYLKFLIVGTGGTGGSIGGFLALSGYDVTLIARGEHLKKIKQDGLRLNSDIKGDIVINNIKACTSEEYEGKADVIFVCVKSYSIDSIIPLLKKAAHKNTLVIPILNGFDMGEKINKKFDEAYVLDGCIYIVSFLSAPGEIRQMGDILRVVYGVREDSEVPYEKLEEIKKALVSAGINTVISDNIKRDTFRKFSFISTYAACGAYYNINSGQMQSTKEYKNTFIRLLKEFKAVADAMNIVFDVDIVETNLKILEAMEPDSTASMQKDLAYGKQSEMDGIVFEVVRLADKYHVEVPNYKMIAESFGYTEK